MNGSPKPAFYVVLFLVVAGLVAWAVKNSDVIAPKANKENHQEPISAKDLDPNPAEAKDTASVTTVQEYQFVPQAKLPPVTSVSGYKNFNKEAPVVRFAYNVWAGWGPIILANEGTSAGKIWKTPSGKEFKVELVKMDEPVAMRDAYAAGSIHIGWATLDMLPLFLESFVESDGKPKAGFDIVMPRVYQQVDWSNGGDGIVCRDTIRTVADLRGKKVAFAQNSPSHFFLLNMLVYAGVQPSEIVSRPTLDAFQAAAAFEQKQVDAAVSWAPDIYKLADVKGNRKLITTVEANQLIADVWFARADFAKDNPEIIEGLARGIFDAMQELKKDDVKSKCATLMAKAYNIPETDALGMFADAHSTNWAENYQFFLNANNPTNFENIWRRSYLLYGRIRAITHQPVPFDQVMDFSVIQKLGKETKYSSQKDEYKVDFKASSVAKIEAENDKILTNTIYIHFYPNSDDPYKKITKDIEGKTTEVLYEPKIKHVLQEVGVLAKTLGGSRVIIEGHTDGSMRGKVPPDVVKSLSQRRAESIRRVLLTKEFGIEPNRIASSGKGWDDPSDANDPDNHAKNRRVEIKVYAAEQQ